MMMINRMRHHDTLPEIKSTVADEIALLSCDCIRTIGLNTDTKSRITAIENMGPLYFPSIESINACMGEVYFEIFILADLYGVIVLLYKSLDLFAIFSLVKLSFAKVTDLFDSDIYMSLYITLRQNQ